jgi:2-polyprenyl-3-methyl-5-hydroxy-6-metoxy-1,4-benzoquinol methylase
MSVRNEGWENYYREQRGASAWNEVPDAFLVENLESLLGLGAERIIDVACGDGRNSWPFLDRNLSLIGVDLSGSALGAFRTSCLEAGVKPLPLLLAADIFKAGILDQQFDAAICFNSLSHFPSPVQGIEKIGDLKAWRTCRVQRIYHT